MSPDQIADREAGAAVLRAALRQCGISVQYAIAGPAEMWDVMGIVMESEWFARHERGNARQEEGS